MKKLILLLSVCLFIAGCEEKAEVEKTTTKEYSIYGKWEVVDIYINDGSGGKWVTPTGFAKFVYDIKPTGDFTTTQYSNYGDTECVKGKFTVENSFISFAFDCNNIYHCTGGSICKESFWFEDENTLNITATYIPCDEGCPIYKFKKISDYSTDTTYN